MDPESEKVPTLGRGRGRGARQDAPEVANAPSSSTSEKRPAANGNTVAGGNGQKRGTTRDQRQITAYRTRPIVVEKSKEGTSGQPIDLSANYFALQRKPQFKLGMYRVDFEPEVESLQIRRFLIGSQREAFGGYIYDEGSIIYVTKPIPERQEFEVESRNRDQPEQVTKYKMIVKYTGVEIDMTGAAATQVLNTLLRRTIQKMNLQLVGRHYYDAANPVILNDLRLQLWPGYVTSIRQHEQEILVCCEVSHKVMRQETIYEILRACRQNGNGWQEDFKRDIIGSVVLTDYNNATYRVDDVDFNSSPSSTFRKGDQDVRYYDYYQQRYHIEIRDRNQPMLVSNPKARDVRAGREQVIYLIPELCKATGLTERMRSNFQQMRVMAEHTQMDPQRRRVRLLDFTNRIHRTDESVQQLNNFNVDIGRDLIRFKGRRLGQETILFGRGKEVQNDDRVDWTDGCKRNQMFHSVPLTRWMIIFPSRTKTETTDFVRLLKEVASGMNYDLRDPRAVEMPDDRLPTYRQYIEDCCQKDPSMLLIVVPTNAADRYATIKKMTCVERSIPTQVIVWKTMQSKKGPAGVKSIATKVMIQLNCKLGGAPWMIKFPCKGTMSIGFDVTHDTKDKSKSFGAFVASFDLQKDVKYFSAVSQHRDGNEVSTNIETHMVQALKVYYQKYSTLPERIFFYRDGVGDGQIEHVHAYEVQLLEKKLKELYTRHSPDKQPMFSFIIVSKRINTRIFHAGNNFSNPPSGTVVDHTITLPERYDFYLISQSVRQGTVAPTSYNVIHDTNGLPPDRMQMLTYKQCHLYYNWSGTTRVPAVVQYAHKLAFLVGQFLHQIPSEGFDNTLYFL